MNPASVSSGIHRVETDLKERTFAVQDYCFLVFRSIKSAFAANRYFSDLIEQMDIIGVGSLRIILVALTCVGGVVVLNAAGQFRRFGETSLTADAVSLALLRELGPVFTALLVATVLVMPLLTALGVCAGLVGGFAVASTTLHVPYAQFWTRAIDSLQLGDLVIGFVKPLIFGFLVASVGC